MAPRDEEQRATVQPLACFVKPVSLSEYPAAVEELKLLRAIPGHECGAKGTRIHAPPTRLGQHTPSGTDEASWPGRRGQEHERHQRQGDKAQFSA